jgi:hypothetical protein
MVLDISTKEIQAPCLVANIYANGFSFADNLVSIDQIWESDGWICLDQFGLVLLEPLFSGLGLPTFILDLFIAEPCVL